MRRLTTPLVYGALLALAIGLQLLDLRLVETLRLRVFDAYQQLAPRPYEPVPVRIVAIDDASLARIGQWPWPRDVLADLLDRLADAGVTSAALAIVFAEPDRASPARMLAVLRDVPGFSPGFSPDFAIDEDAPAPSLRDNDLVLAERMAAQRTVASFALTQSEAVAQPALRWGVVALGDDPIRLLPRFLGAVTNIAPIEAAVAAQGALNVLVDRDGVVRSVPILSRLGDEAYPSLVPELLRHVQGASSYVVRTAPAGRRFGLGEGAGIDVVRIGGLEVPTTPEGAALLRFSGHRPERFVPAWQVLDGSAAPALLADHLVLIGTSATGLGNVLATPLTPAMTGVEVQAEFLEQLLLGQFLVRPDWAPAAEVVLLLGLGGLLLVLLQRVGARSGALVGGVVVALAVAASVAAFLEYGLLLDPVLPSLTLLAIYLAATVLGYVRTEAERAAVRRAFGLYLSPALVERLAANPEQLRLGGESRDLTLLFADIRDFTSRSETMTAPELTRFINRYLTPMTDVIQGHDGTVDKYMGDGIMAFWNAPLDVPEHARRAAEAALAMRARLAVLNADLAAEAGSQGFTPIRIGIGLDSGPCSVGNLGSERRFSYSAIGEPVNVAARFEGQCKTFGFDILASARTRAGAAALAFLELDRRRLVGASRAEAIFALLGDAGLAKSPGFLALLAQQNRFLAAYRAQDWDGAEAALVACRSNPLAAALHGYYRGMAERVAAFRSDPPPPDWDGVSVAEHK